MKLTPCPLCGAPWTEGPSAWFFGAVETTRSHDPGCPAELPPPAPNGKTPA